MSKRIASALLTLAMILSLLSPAALADETKPENPAQPADRLLPEEEPAPAECGGSGLPENDVQSVPSLVKEYREEASPGASEERYTPDELLEGYFAQQFYGEAYGSGTYQDTASHVLTDPIHRKMYDLVKAEIGKIAAGERKSTVISITAVQLGLVSGTSFDDYGPDIQTKLDGILNSVKLEDMSAIFQCLLSDCAFELYWYDKAGKTDGTACRTGMASNVDNDQKTIHPTWTYSLTVWRDYRANPTDGYTVRGDLSAVKTAAENAGKIAPKRAGESDYDALVRYKDYICGQVSYDHAAAGSGSLYGDPWQMISVFDENPNTNVVCEGYSKAFQYLCDMGGLEYAECYTVSGVLRGGTGDTGGGHMWNIVKMEDGRSYLADITNSDEGTAGSNGSLFLVGAVPASGSYAGQDLCYTFSTLGGGNTTYQYDSTQNNRINQYIMHPQSVLVLAEDHYTPAGRVAITPPAAAVTIPVSESAGPAEISFSAADAALPDAVFTWSVARRDGGAVTGVTIAGGVLRVASTAAPGEYTVTAASASGAAGTASVTLVEAEACQISGPSERLTLFVGETRNAGITSATPGAVIRYVSQDERVVSAAADGTLTANGNGTASVTATASAAGCKDAVYTITVTVKSKSLADAVILIDGIGAYTGTAQTPVITVKAGATVLTIDTDYTLSIVPAKVLDAGDYTVAITGKGAYEGTASKRFSIDKAQVTEITTTVPPQTISASHAQNTGADALRTVMNLPDQAGVAFDGGTGTMPLTWSVTPDFHRKGATYTYTGTLMDTNNLSGSGKTLTAVLTVRQVTAAYSLSKTANAVKASTVTGAASYADFGLPETVTVSYDDGTTPGMELSVTRWDKTVAEIAAEAAKITGNEAVTLTLTPTVNAPALPEWATVVGGIPVFRLTLTGRNLATVSFTARPADILYGQTVTAPAAKAEEVPGAAFRYTYTGTTAAGTAYLSATPPKDAGSYKVTAELIGSDEYSGSAEAEFSIEPLTAVLTWSGHTGLTYDGTAKNVTAAVSNLLSGDRCAVAVTGGSEKNAGSYTATAALSNPNYKLPDSGAVQVYHIAKADWTLTVTPARLTLTPGNPSGTITATVTGVNGETGTAKLTPAGDLAAVTVDSRTGTVTAIGNGTAAITVSVDETGNYNAPASQTVMVKAYAQPVIELGSLSSDDPAAKLLAILDADVIKVSGVIAEGKAITGIAAVLADGLTSTYADSRLTVRDGEDVIAEYRVDLSGVAATSYAFSENTIPGTMGTRIPDDKREEVQAAVEDTVNNKVDGVAASAGKGLVEAAEEALSGINTGGKSVEIEIRLKLEAKSITETSYTIDVTPQYRIVLTEPDEDGEVVVADTALPNRWFAAPVTVSVRLPASITAALKAVPGKKLFAKHTRAGGEVEYLAAVLNGSCDVASWKMSSFSSVELYVTADKTVTVTFQDRDTETVITYSEVHRGEALPPTSNGQPWIINGSAYTTVAQLLEDPGITGSVTAVPKAVPAPTPTPIPTPTPDPAPGGGSSSGSSSGSSASGNTASSGGSSGAAAISAKPVSNGSVSLSSTRAKKGDTVTITPRPNPGYALDSLRVLDSGGREVTLRAESGGRYSFVMPGGNVSVEAIFRRAGIEEESSPFADIADCWAKDAIVWAYENGYVNGVSATSFQSDGYITRQQMWMILARLSGIQPGSMAEARTWAMRNSISDGTNAANPMTRQQMVAFLHRYARLNGYPLTGAGDLTRFPDHAAVSGYAQEAFSWAAANGIVSGTSAGTLNPGGTATRAQFAVILQRFYQAVIEA